MPTETQEPSLDEVWGARIEEDHHALRESLDRLEDTSDPHLLLPLLDDLHAQLKEHFEREESPDGLQDFIAGVPPGTVASLQDVLGEHRGFLTRLERLIDQTQQCLQGPVAEILRQVRELSESLHDHEARESRLFLDAVFTDLGRSS